MNYYINKLNDKDILEEKGFLFLVKKGKLNLDDYYLATQSEVDAILNPPKSNDELFNEELDQLNNDKDSKIKGLVEDYSYAVAVDGSTETEKVISIRNEMTEVNDQYAVDQLALINKYYGE
jgi:hypothetical protein